MPGVLCCWVKNGVSSLHLSDLINLFILIIIYVKILVYSSLYRPFTIKSRPPNYGCNFVKFYPLSKILLSLQTVKFYTKSIYYFPPHLKRVSALTRKLKVQILQITLCYNKEPATKRMVVLLLNLSQFFSLFQFIQQQV